MSYFNSTALPLILIFEGSFVDDPLDKGGRTNKGITQKTYDKYRIVKSLPINDVKNIEDTEVSDIYYTSYWLPSKCDVMHEKLATAVFDTSVNNGQSRSIKFLQQAIGAKIDGIIGPETILKLADYDQTQLTKNFLSNREDFYKSIVKNDPSQAKFLTGWLRRLNFLRDFVNDLKTVNQIKALW